ncbi:hypothetical protein ACSMX9_22095 [Streptomyces sp. LE64]|uniref:hypothetical protein n=1 Tax=Streptomyces sp. LE64 TaxID=3448653 RepID=UPI0040431C30
MTTTEPDAGGPGGSTDRPPHDRSVPRSVRATRWEGAGLVLAALFAAAVSAAVFTVWLPHGIERYREFAAAEPCPVRAAEDGPLDCVRTLTFTVRSTEVDKVGRNDDHRVTLHRPPSWTEVVSLGLPRPPMERLRPGHRVAATVWRGDITSISWAGERQRTSEEPFDEPQALAAIGTFAGLLAALWLGFGAVRLLTPHRVEPFVWRGYGMPLFYTMLIVSVLAGALALVLEWPWWLVPALVVPFVAYTAREFYRYRRKAPLLPGAPPGAPPAPPRG